MKNIILFFVFLFAPFAGASPLPEPEVEVLSNGLQVAWFLNNKIPLVDISLLVKSGSRDNPIGKTGTAELVSALLDRGTEGMNSEAFAHAVESLGASRYSSADDDTSSMGVHGLALDASKLLGLLQKMALKPEFPESEVARERDRMIDYWSHISDYPESLAGLAFQEIIRNGTSYGRGTFLAPSELKNIKREDLLSFHKINFTPKNAILVVIGQVDRQTMHGEIEKQFGAQSGWTGEAPERNWKNFTNARFAFHRGQLLVVDRPGIPQAQIRIGFRAPGIKSPDHYSLTVANAMLGEYFNSRLNSIIRDKLGLTYSIGSGFNYSRDLASFAISTATKNESVGQLIRKVIEVLNEFKQGPIPSDEVEMARNYLLGGFPLNHSVPNSVAARWLQGQYYDLGPTYLNAFIPAVEKVNSPDVIAAVNRSFSMDQLVIVIAGDAGPIEKSLAGFKLGTVRRIAVKDFF